MTIRTPTELRAKAECLRKMAEDGEDWRLQEALRLVAEEFDQEAARRA